MSRAAFGVCALAVLILVVGVVGVARRWERRAVREASLAGVSVRLQRADWVPEAIDHGDREGISAASVSQTVRAVPVRLSFAFTLINHSREPQTMRADDWRVERGGHPLARAIAAPEITLPPGFQFETVAAFDLPQNIGEVELTWHRGAEQARLLTTSPPLEQIRAPGWPKDVEELPRGDALAGARLFTGRLQCITCHGTPVRPAVNATAPQLGNIGAVAAGRVPGKSADQYLYESVLDPNAAIAPVCPGQIPCPRPSTMPFYGELLNWQEMADLVAFLRSQQRP
jgi:hypothetical protein